MTDMATDDVHEPLELYRDALKERHARNTSDYFDALHKESGIDIEANAKTVAEIEELDRSISEAGSSNGLWKFLRIALWIACAGFIYASIYIHILYSIGAVGSALFIFLKINQAINSIEDQIAEWTAQRAEKETIAWKQMEPLNRLYHWEILSELIQKTLPTIEIDPYFSRGRLTNLKKKFGWKEDFNESRSVVFAHSGLINGNPFILAQSVSHWIGIKTYEGTLSISWTERVRSSNGQWTTVRRHQTLRATVDKPFPEYADESTLIFGNEAAPDLSFSREPSSLSGLDDGMISNWRKKRAIKKLESFSRNLTDDSDFTIMANREFDALFNAVDRDHEVQFRLLFTPLAQQEMLQLLKDKEVGYGDQFAFKKSKMINIIEPDHLDGVDISADPEMFKHYNFDHARKYFNDYHNSTFKGVFFSFAPLLSIPLYQHTKPASSIYAGILQEPSCYWEHEAIANYIGEGKFEHPDCITRNVLKTSVKEAQDGIQVVQVTADGYRGINRIDHVRMRGGDGRTHSVPVKWTEYIPVTRTSDILVSDPDESDMASQLDKNVLATSALAVKRGISPKNIQKRRAITFSIGDKKSTRKKSSPA